MTRFVLGLGLVAQVALAQDGGPAARPFNGVLEVRVAQVDQSASADVSGLKPTPQLDHPALKKLLATKLGRNEARFRTALGQSTGVQVLDGFWFATANAPRLAGLHEVAWAMDPKTGALWAFEIQTTMEAFFDDEFPVVHIEVLCRQDTSARGAGAPRALPLSVRAALNRWLATHAPVQWGDVAFDVQAGVRVR